MPLLQEFIKNIQQQNLFHKNDYLLVAVSGGADSVALCELCFQAGLHFEIAHCNFKLRGEESDRDEQFVRKLGEKYCTKVFVKNFDTQKYAEGNKISIQVAARELRYKWFDRLLKEEPDVSDPLAVVRYQALDNGAQLSKISSQEIIPSPVTHTPGLRKLLTAHHANDNVETLLMNFFKGTGIKGLQGILSKQGPIIRPLLFAKKEEIVTFIKENNLQFVEDSSNSSDKYTRNYFRHQLIPSVQKVFPQAEENLINNIERFNEIKILYLQSIELHKHNLLEQKGNETHIPVLKLLKSKPLRTVIYEIIKDYGFTAHQTDEVIHLLNSDTGKFVSSATHRIFKNRKWLIIAPVENSKFNTIMIYQEDIETSNRVVDFELGELKFKKHPGLKGTPLVSNEIAMLDLKNISFPLMLRKWKQGDYFYPLGMPGKKKLSKFFIDQKMSLTEKEKIWVIESDKRILWVIGKRVDDRFKITNKTESALYIQFSKS
ncbi:MAG: tRNA lysidine(34) synthetase TilS [Ginsengibacter sp.]